MFGQVGDRVSQVKDQVGHGRGQGHELDNICPHETRRRHITQYMDEWMILGRVDMTRHLDIVKMTL